jgi:hypothetical protein
MCTLSRRGIAYVNGAQRPTAPQRDHPGTVGPNAAVAWGVSRGVAVGGTGYRPEASVPQMFVEHSPFGSRQEPIYRK